MLELTLPWPPTILSPNARPHWAAKAKAVKEYRREGYLAARIALSDANIKGVGALPVNEKLHLWIDFHPPSNRRIDDDNCLSRLKPGRDGIAEYLGIDDRMFISHPMVKEKVAGGCVRIRITTGPTEDYLK